MVNDKKMTFLPADMTSLSKVLSLSNVSKYKFVNSIAIQLICVNTLIHL